MSYCKVMVVDDEKTISGFLQRKMTKLGYTVFVADDGEDALHQAFSHSPDVILLDVKLPKLSGIEVCRKLKDDERTKRIPIIILSAKAQSAEIQEGFEAGADRYLCKPVSFPQILAEIRNLEDL